MTQTEAVIAAIRNKPFITRSELFDLRVDGFRIANLTARITNARQQLAKTGQTIVCDEIAPIKKGNRSIRATTYRIVDTPNPSKPPTDWKREAERLKAENETLRARAVMAEYELNKRK